MGMMCSYPWDHVLVVEGGRTDWVPKPHPEWPSWCYALWTVEGTCLYVGQSRALAGRLRSHLQRDWEAAPYYVTLTRSAVDEVDGLEAQLIRQLRPVWNVSLGATRQARQDAARWALDHAQVMA